MRRRLLPETRKDEILDAALRVCARVGLDATTRAAVATESGASEATVSHYFNTMTQLRRAVARAAVSRREMPVLAVMVSAAAYGKYVRGELRVEVLGWMGGR